MTDAGSPETGAPPPGARPARYPRTANGLIGSMIVTVLLVGGFVALRSLATNDLEVKPTAVDYLSVVAPAQESGFAIVYPPQLPNGWMATSVDYTPGSRPAWGVGMLTENGRFAGLRQEDRSLDELLETYVDDEAIEGDPVNVEGSVAPVWRSFSDDGGDHAFAAEVGDEIVLVYGSADVEALLALLERLTAEAR
ncbi:DUF4245 domain-containing protein [Nocardioides sp.]|uniref:DUF4245 domain-containing protein n=1 Tax=Nocardioides sp. TaxID=35761 RepID=UPI003565D29D